MKLISIDPGQQGALCFLESHPPRGKKISVLDVFPMPDLSKEKGKSELLKTLTRWIGDGADTFLLETQSPRGGNSAQASFSHGRGYGILEMAISCALPKGREVAIIYVTPGYWMSKLPDVVIDPELVPLGLKDTKKKTISLTSRYFPEIAMRTPKGKYLDGIADALMMGWWFFHNGDKPLPGIIKKEKRVVKKKKKNPKEEKKVDGRVRSSKRSLRASG